MVRYITTVLRYLVKNASRLRLAFHTPTTVKATKGTKVRQGYLDLNQWLTCACNCSASALLTEAPAGVGAGATGLDALVHLLPSLEALCCSRPADAAAAAAASKVTFASSAVLSAQVKKQGQRRKENDVDKVTQVKASDTKGKPNTNYVNHATTRQSNVKPSQGIRTTPTT